MDVNDLKGLYAESTKRMGATIDHVRHELAGVRTGRASVTILESVHVDAYGSKMPLNQLASLSVPEPTMIVAQPFDPSQLGAIEKAIRASDLGLNPSNDGKVVRVPIPALTEERRKELSRHVHKLTEEGRNSVRAVRRDANERLKKLLKDHKISEDDERKGLDEVRGSPTTTSSRSTSSRRRKTRSYWASKKQEGCPCSPIWSAPSRAERPRSIRTAGISCARAALPCSPATISTRPQRGLAKHCAAACRTCGGIAS